MDIPTMRNVSILVIALKVQTKWCPLSVLQRRIWERIFSPLVRPLNKRKNNSEILLFYVIQTSSFILDQ